MSAKTSKARHGTDRLFKFFVYFVLILLAITIIVPVAWVFLASIKQNSEFYGNPWTLPMSFYWHLRSSASRSSWAGSRDCRRTRSSA